MRMLRSPQGRAVPSLAALLLAALSAALLSACGGSSKTVSMTVSENQTGPRSYSYTGLKTLDGGTVKITFTNAARSDPHEIQLVRVDSGHSAAEVKAAFVKLLGSNTGGVPIPNWLHPQGGVGVTPPGQTSTATVKLPKGTYYAVDTQSPGADNSPPFLTQGAFASFNVSSGSGASLPKTSGKITVNDEPKDRFAFAVSGLKTGTDQVTFDNASKEYHHVLAVPLLPGKTLAQARAALLSNGPPKGPPPIDFQHLTGTTVSNTKTTQTAQLTFTKPGKYVLFCFLTDKDGKGKPHVARGLLKEVNIS